MSNISIERKHLVLAAVVAMIVTLLSAATAATGATGPKWKVESLANTTAQPGDGDPSTAELTFGVVVRNVGDSFLEASAEQPFTFEAAMPLGLTLTSVSIQNNSWICPAATVGDTDYKCVSTEAFGPILGPSWFSIKASVAPDAEGLRTARFRISGGAGIQPAEAVDPTLITPDPPSFGIDGFDASPVNDAGTAFTQAGRHPDSFTVQTDFTKHTDQRPFVTGDSWPVEPPRDALVELPPGFVGNPTVVPHCTGQQLLGVNFVPTCPASSQIGLNTIRTHIGGLAGPTAAVVGLYNMEPPPGVAARFGFNFAGVLTLIDARLQQDGRYGLTVGPRNISEGLPIIGNELTMWGVPGDSSHTAYRPCPKSSLTQSACVGTEDGKPFFRMPTSCSGPGQGLTWSMHADSWFHSAAFDGSGFPDLRDPSWKTASISSHELPGYPADPADPSTPWGGEVGVTDCDEVPVKGKMAAKPTAIDATTPTGLSVVVDVPNQGMEFAEGIASSDLKKVKVTLPEGMTINPSQAEGLGVCSPAQYESTELSFYPSDATGCPSDSKIGTVSVKSPLLEETIPGDVYVAKPFDNPFGTLLALYVVMEEPQRGILIKLPAKVQTDERTGQIVTTFDDLPQQPFDSFDFKFREGARAPLVSPAACGTYETKAEFTGYSDLDGPPVISRSSFEIIHGVGGGPCPTGGLPPFKPGLIAGSINNAAGKYSPFNVRLFRTDAEQEFTNFSIKLPPGISGKLAGVPFCPETAIAVAKTKSGAQELTSPSCPAASEVGRTLAGAGVGSVLTYAPGKVYLAGPYNGSALSVISITAAKVGPFDLGTVVVRLALRVDPETAEVFVDATGSDPIPHIIDGIALHLRDIRNYVDKPEFTLNPTSCARTSTASTLLGSGLDFSSAADDRPVTVSTPYQAADCAALGFKPKLKLLLKGGTKRGGHPALRAIYTPRAGDANVARAQVTLPKSAFLDQSNIGTVCTRVQFAKDQCPAKSIYGYATATTPILDEALQGPVYLRSSEHKLPDLVARLRSGKIEVHLVGRIDSLDGRIRSTFEATPDAPITKFTLNMQGARKGLIQNSTNLCKGTHRAIVELDAHNGKIQDANPAVKADCASKRKKSKKR